MIPVNSGARKRTLFDIPPWSISGTVRTGTSVRWKPPRLIRVIGAYGIAADVNTTAADVWTTYAFIKRDIFGGVTSFGQLTLPSLTELQASASLTSEVLNLRTISPHETIEMYVVSAGPISPHRDVTIQLYAEEAS